jgi:cytochrome c
MKTLLTASATLLVLAAPALAAGDAAKGEKEFNKCKSCHMIESADEVIVKGGKVGPNLYGVIGRAAGSVDGFKYSDGLAAKGSEGLVWDEATVAEFVQDPNGFLGDRSKMTFKLKKGAEDVAAYLATFSQ